MHLPAETLPSACIVLLFCCVWDISGHHTLYLLLTIASCCMWSEQYEKKLLFSRTLILIVLCGFVWATKLGADHAHRFVSVCHLYHTGMLNGHKLKEEVCGSTKFILEVLQSCICVGILKHNQCKTLRKWHFIFLLHCFFFSLSWVTHSPHSPSCLLDHYPLFIICWIEYWSLNLLFTKDKYKMLHKAPLMVTLTNVSTEIKAYVHP